MSSINVGLRAQISLLTLAVALSVAAVSLGAVAFSLRRELASRLEQGVRRDALSLLALIRQRGEVLSAATRTSANGPVLKAALSASDFDAATMAGIAESQRAAIGADLLVIVGADGDVRAIVPESGDASGGESLAGLEGKAPTVRALGTRLYLLASQPVEVGRAQLGFLIAGREVGDEMLGAFATESGSQALLRADSGAQAHALTSVEPASLAAALRDAPLELTRVRVDGAELLVHRAMVAPGVEAVLARDRDAEFEQFGGTLWLLVLVGACSALAASGAGMLMAGRLTRPLVELNRAASRVVTEGDFGQRIEVQGTAEIRTLSESFGAMMDRFRDVLETLRASAGLLQKAAGELSASATEQGGALSRQAGALQETQVTAQEIKQTSIVAAQKADSVLRVAERADEVGRIGEASIEDSLSGLSEMREQVDQISSKMGELGERARLIGTITQSVKDLADQSNMLALNAAIEAVRSGEHGKGFTVVAREIRTLADQSIQATGRARDILEDIAQSVRSAAAITERGAKRMETGLEQVRSSGNNLRELSGILRDNSVAVRQIAASVSQQNAGITQIFTAVSDLSSITEESLKRIDATSEAAANLKQVSESVAAVLSSYRT